MKPIFTQFTEQEFLDTPMKPHAYANAKLAKLIESWPVVYGYGERNLAPWQSERTKSELETHQARLAFIEEIPKKECEHEPDHFKCAFHPICKHCGVELFAEWKAK